MTTTNDAPALASVATWHPLDENGLAELRVNGKRVTTFPSYPAAEEAAQRINAALSPPPTVGAPAPSVESVAAVIAKWVDEKRFADAPAFRMAAREIIASLASDASPRGEAVAWQVTLHMGRDDEDGGDYWETSIATNPAFVAGLDPVQNKITPLYAHPAPATVENPWRDIKTAPKARRVLVKFQSGEVEVCYQTDHGGGLMDSWRYAFARRGEQAPWPTEWCEIPAALAPATEGRKG